MAGPVPLCCPHIGVGRGHAHTVSVGQGFGGAELGAALRVVTQSVAPWLSAGAALCSPDASAACCPLGQGPAWRHRHSPALCRKPVTPPHPHSGWGEATCPGRRAAGRRGASTGSGHSGPTGRKGKRSAFIPVRGDTGHAETTGRTCLAALDGDGSVSERNSSARRGNRARGVPGAGCPAGSGPEVPTASG